MVLICVSSFMASCSDDDDVFPSMISELADALTDSRGRITVLLRDDGSQLTVSNDVSGFKANVGYRCVCGYVKGIGNQVELLSLSPAYVLYDCAQTDLRAQDPLGVVSVWRGGKRYLNMHLLPKTKGTAHRWGYLCDSVRTNGAGGTTYYISLQHDQGTDTLSYSSDYYMSVTIDSLTTSPVEGDSACLDIMTWGGIRRYGLSLK